MLQGLAMALLEQGSSGSSLESSPAASAQGPAAEVLLGPGPSFGGSLVKYFGKRRGGLYCVLPCEGQTKHTAMVTGSRPAWKQELSFKSVQISSDLQVLPQARLADLTPTAAAQQDALPARFSRPAMLHSLVKGQQARERFRLAWLQDADTPCSICCAY